MKPHDMKSVRLLLITTALCLFSLSIFGQEDTKPPDRPVADMFGSSLLIDNQTVVIPFKGTFQFDIQHRFGTWDEGYDDFWGFFAPSNFRLGFNYVPAKKLQMGFGFSKENLLWDFSMKYAILEQSRSGAKPLSIAYLANMAVDTRDLEKTIYNKGGDRLSYFHQLMFARKFSDHFSMQFSANYVHFNFVNAVLGPNNEVIPTRNNNHWSGSFLTRLKTGEGSAILLNLDIPFTDHEMELATEGQISTPEANVSFGFEFTTSSHAFQIFIGNYQSIVPQYNHLLSTNSFGDNEILIGFNMTRLWSL